MSDVNPSRSRKFLKHLYGNSLAQVLMDMIRKHALLDLILVNRESHMDEMAISSHHGNNDNKVVKFKILGDRRKTATKTSTLNTRRTDFRLLEDLISKVP